MEMHRKTGSRMAERRDGSHRHVLTVGLPQPYEGVGNALRSTFRARRDCLPDDMMELLDKLDRQ